MGGEGGSEGAEVLKGIGSLLVPTGSARGAHFFALTAHNVKHLAALGGTAEAAVPTRASLQNKKREHDTLPFHFQYRSY